MKKKRSEPSRFEKIADLMGKTFYDMAQEYSSDHFLEYLKFLTRHIAEFYKKGSD